MAHDALQPLINGSNCGRYRCAYGAKSHCSHAASSTTYTPDPYAVSKAEAQFYYAGLRSKPTLLYRTGKEQWSPPKGPEAKRRLKELCPVFTHPISKVWDDLGWKVVENMDAYKVSYLISIIS